MKIAKNKYGIDYLKLYKSAENNHKTFIQEQPFPHFVLDNFLDAKHYDLVKNIFPSANSAIWKNPSNRHTIGKFVTIKGEHGLKELYYSEKARRFFHELNSGLFLNYLEKLSGIKGLLPDPYFAEGGFHRTERSGYLDIHADFSHHEKIGLERRLNLIFYLNDFWEEDFGGELGLYDVNMRLVKSISPIGNRLVIFETSDTSFHGHPIPLNVPNGVSRNSIALYYYSIPRPERGRKKILFPSEPEFVNEITSE